MWVLKTLDDSFSICCTHLVEWSTPVITSRPPIFKIVNTLAAQHYQKKSAPLYTVKVNDKLVANEETPKHA